MTRIDYIFIASCLIIALITYSVTMIYWITWDVADMKERIRRIDETLNADKKSPRVHERY